MAIDSNLLSPAEELLWSYGVRKPEHIDLEAIAYDKGAIVVYRHLDGCAARLVTDGAKAIISIAESDNQGRQRFSLGHELAHWINDAKKASFKCANDDIGPQNADAKSAEANANGFASQLVLPDYLVAPWMVGRKLTLNVATELAGDFKASLTASAIKLVKRAGSHACVAVHTKAGLRWFQKSKSWPFDIYVRKELHQDTAAFDIAFGASNRMSTPRKEQAGHWVTGPDVYRMTVESQSSKLPDGSVLTMLALTAPR